MSRLALCNAYEGRAPLADRVVVGAPPITVEAGLPASRDEVRAYADRIAAAWQSFVAVDVQPWAVGAGLVGASGLPKEIEDAWGAAGSAAWPKEILDQWGQLAPSTPSEPAPEPATPPAAPSPKTTKKDQALYLAKVRADRLAFDTYKGEISSFDIAGPSPSQAWQRLQLFEKTLQADRAAFQSISGIAPKSDVPAQLEDPGGVQRDSGMGKIVLVVGLLAGAWALSSVARVVRG